MKKKKTFWRKVKASRRRARMLWRKVKFFWQKLVPVLLASVGVLGVVLFLLLFVVMFNECVEYWAKRTLGVGRKREVIEFIGWGIAGILAFFGAIAVNKRADAQVGIAKAQVETVKTQFENNKLIEKGHVQERFKAAVGHLGSEREGARIASFYEFSYLARDNTELRRNIFDILCAHLRQTTADKEYQRKIEFTDEGDNSKVRPTEEVQSLLDILFQKGSQEKLIFEGFISNLRRIFLVGVNLQKANLHKANLHKADLRGTELQGADLREADLYKAYFEGASLEDADLQGANLFGAKLQKVILSGAKLQKVNLQVADLQKANLVHADLRGADLLGTSLLGAHLRGADLRGADLQGVNLQGADLQGANLEDANLQGALLQKVILSGAKLQNANLDHAELQGAELHNADLDGVNLCRADLRDADLRSVKNLEKASLSGAKIKGAKFPDGYEPPADVDND